MCDHGRIGLDEIQHYHLPGISNNKCKLEICILKEEEAKLAQMLAKREKKRLSMQKHRILRDETKRLGYGIPLKYHKYIYIHEMNTSLHSLKESCSKFKKTGLVPSCTTYP
jgi:hypothetical protein